MFKIWSERKVDLRLRRSKHSDVGIKRCRDVRAPSYVHRERLTRLTRDSVQRVSVSNEGYNIFCANLGNYFQEVGGNICRRNDILFDSISWCNYFFIPSRIELWKGMITQWKSSNSRKFDWFFNRIFLLIHRVLKVVDAASIPIHLWYYPRVN